MQLNSCQVREAAKRDGASSQTSERLGKREDQAEVYKAAGQEVPWQQKCQEKSTGKSEKIIDKITEEDKNVKEYVGAKKTFDD